METIELVIYISAAVIVAGLALYLIAGVPIQDYSSRISDMLLGRSTQAFKHVDDTGFMEELVSFWEDHQWSDKEAMLVLFYESEGSISKRSLFEAVRKNNLCRTLQSASFGCGEREDVVMGEIMLPSVVRLTYKDERLFITPGQPLVLPNTTYQMSMTTFGGFVGNGNITANLETLPPDALVTSLTLEGIFGSDFDLLINGARCNMTFSPMLDRITWDITGCSDLLMPGAQNMISLRFHSTDIYRDYVAGGYISAVYRSAETMPPVTRLDLPMINGSISYFGSVEMMGLPQYMHIVLDYTLGDLNGTDFFVAVGNSTIYKDAVPGRRKTADFIVPQQYLVEGPNLIRIGIGSNITSMKEIQLPQPVDAVLITDVSGSMAFRMDQDYSDTVSRGVVRQCTDPLLLSPDTQRLSLAKCFAKEFIQIILEKYNKNRVGLVSFAESVKPWANVTNDRPFLENQIDGYVATGGTCLSCSIAKANDILAASDRAKAMVIMTDGCANHIIPGINVDTGACYNAQAFDEAMQKAEEARAQNISLFTIAFGKMDPAGLQLMQDIACLDNCTNFGWGDNATEIQKIYKNFAERIARKQAVQTMHVQGSGEGALPESILHESYIEYAPMEKRDGSLQVGVLQAIGCHSTVTVPSSIASASILSWAGTLWTVAAEVDGTLLFDSSNSSEMIGIGDPFSIGIPISMLANESVITVKASDVKKTTQCADNDLLYFAHISLSNFTFAEGCHWTIDVNGKMRKLDAPPGYVGDRYCEYTRDARSFNASDRYQGSVGELLSEIDRENDGVIKEDIRGLFVVG